MLVGFGAKLHWNGKELTQKVWRFPNDRFVEYDESDEAWARPIGFGKEVEQPVPFTFSPPTT